MSTPGASSNPGWYPSPDGNGQQWWNGASWSDARRAADGSSPVRGGLPGYQAAPPPGQAQHIPVPPPQAGIRSGASGASGSWIIPLVFSIVGLLVFNLFAIFALIAGVATFRIATPFGKVVTAVAIIISIAAIVSGVISFIQGHRSVQDIIF